MYYHLSQQYIGKNAEIKSYKPTVTFLFICIMENNQANNFQNFF